MYSPPAFVKTASHEQLHGDPESLPPQAYAWPAQRLFPVHTKAAAFASAMFLATRPADVLPPDTAAAVKRAVDLAAGFWHIAPEVAAMREKVAAAQQDDLAQLPDSEFAVIWKTANGQQRYCPLRNAHEVKTAASWFEMYRDEFTFPDRVRVAGRILQKAAAMQLDLAEHDDLLNRTAGYGHCGRDDAAIAWEKRAALLRPTHPQEAQVVSDLAADLRRSDWDVRDRDLRLQLAEQMDTLDRRYKLATHYRDGGLTRPEDVLFELTERAAQQFAADHMTTATGAVYQKAAAAALPLDYVERRMGTEFAQAVQTGLRVDTEKLAAALTSLPLDEAREFDRLAMQYGVEPTGYVQVPAALDAAAKRADAIADWAERYRASLAAG